MSSFDFSAPPLNGVWGNSHFWGVLINPDKHKRVFQQELAWDDGKESLGGHGQAERRDRRDQKGDSRLRRARREQEGGLSLTLRQPRCGMGG